MSNFSEEFTTMPATDSPAVVPPNYDKLFRGYSYVAPSSHLSRPDDAALLTSPDSPFAQAYELDPSEPILGDGAFSVCRRCVQRSSGREFAVKIVTGRQDCSEEINMLRACQGHPNIVRVHDVLTDRAHTYIVTELLRGGELLDRIRKRARFTESQASGIFAKLVSAVSFMHSRGVVHRDLKPENLLFTSEADDAELKVVDFGFARVKCDKESLHTPCFTLHYAAPEVLNGNPDGYDETCDLWSLGVILYTMLCGRAPFHSRSQENEKEKEKQGENRGKNQNKHLEKNQSRSQDRERDWNQNRDKDRGKHRDSSSASAVMTRIKTGDFSFDSPAFAGVSEEAKSIVRGLLTVNPAQRLRMADLKSHPWVLGSQNVAETPLMTPDILSSSGSAEKGLQTTFTAFHKAEREGFRLQDVLSAKLAQRRRLKKSSSDNHSSSSSSFTSEGSVKSGPATPTPTPTPTPTLTLTLTKAATKNAKKTDKTKTSTGTSMETSIETSIETSMETSLEMSMETPIGESKDNVFSFRDAKVAAYLSVEGFGVVRESTDSSGIAVSDKNSVDSKEERPLRRKRRKVYEKVRQSERIRRLHRGEIDLEPFPLVLLPTTRRKRKMSVVDTGAKVRKTSKAKR